MGETRTGPREELTAEDGLLAAFVAGRDEAAFERLVARYGPLVLRVCRSILEDHAEAEDAFQATFLHLFRQADTIRNPGAVRPWLCEVAHRVAVRARQVRARRRAQEQRAATAVEAGVAAGDDDWRPILHEEIRRLPARLRESIELCYLEGLTVPAAARRLGCPEGTLKSRLAKGRELLRERLGRRGLAVSAILLLLLWAEGEVDAAPVVPEWLARAAVAGAYGTPAATPGPLVVAEAAAEPPRSRTWRRWWLLLLFLIGVCGALGLALLLVAAALTGLPPTVLAGRFLTELVRSIPFIGKHLCH